MPVGWDAQIEGTEQLWRAVRSIAKDRRINISINVIDILVTRAVANILQRSETDEQFRTLVRDAIGSLGDVAAEVERTPQTTFHDTAAFRAFVRQKACACPWPWGTG